MVWMLGGHDDFIVSVDDPCTLATSIKLHKVAGEPGANCSDLSASEAVLPEARLSRDVATAAISAKAKSVATYVWSRVMPPVPAG